jgi:nucleoside-diphosphate-sugar epimerase
MMKQVSVLGCGWVGLPLATRLVQKGMKVQGTTTTPEKIKRLQAAGIQALMLDLTQNLWPEKFFDCDLLVIAMPPSRGSTVYLDTVQEALKAIQAKTQIVLLSSTSVYASETDFVDENSATKSIQESSICSVEALVQASGHDHAIVRLGGLMGYERNLKRFFSSKTHMHNRPVNYVHQNDVVSFLVHLIHNLNWSHQIYNLVAPLHPTTQEVYQQIAPQDAQRIVWQDAHNKRVICKHLPEAFEFEYPDPKLMFDDVTAL